jgi:4-hydroxy-3-methylbut-2-enyl diphosphate reductase
VSTIANGTLAELLPLPRIPAVRGRLRDEPVAGDKRVLLAAPRGYCAGVDRAVIAVEKALEQYGSPVYVRKQIVHNVHVVSTLESQGAIFVDDVDEVPRGANVVFSAHGVAPSVVEAAAERGLQAIDATCPLVSKVHREAARFARDDYQILLIGHAGHEEVAGTMGYAPERTILVNGPADVPDIEVGDPERLVWLSQTTLSVDETMETVRLLRERFPRLQDPPSDDICYATQNRQLAIKKVSSEAELVIVVGSANSSNSMRLVDVALQNGATRAHRIDYASEIQQDWLAGVAIVGVTSGASVPEVLVREVLDALADAGYARVQEVVTAQEDLVFSLPKELRGTSDGARRAAALDGEER